MKKKILSVLLTVCMLLTLLPATALADTASGIWVGGVHLTAETPYATADADGKVGNPTANAETGSNIYYDAAKSTLLLDNAYINNTTSYNTVQNNQESSSGIYSEGALTILVKGDCSVETGSDSYVNIVIYPDSNGAADLTIQDADDKQTNNLSLIRNNNTSLITEKDLRVTLSGTFSAEGSVIVYDDVSVVCGGNIHLKNLSGNNISLCAGGELTAQYIDASQWVSNESTPEDPNDGNYTYFPVTLAGTIPEGGSVGVAAASEVSVVSDKTLTVKGTLSVPDSATIDKSITIADGGALVYDGSNGMDVSDAAETRTYVDGYGGTAVWEPTLTGDSITGTLVTGGTLTINNFEILDSIILPKEMNGNSYPAVTLVLTGKSWVNKLTSDAYYCSLTMEGSGSLDATALPTRLSSLTVQGGASLNVVNGASVGSLTVDTTGTVNFESPSSVDDVTISAGTLNLLATPYDATTPVPYTVYGTATLGEDFDPYNACNRNWFTFTVTDGASLTIPVGTTLDMSNGTLTNNGVLRVNGTLVLPDDYDQADIQALHLTGGGVVKIGDILYTTAGAKAHVHTGDLDLTDGTHSGATLANDGYAVNGTAVTLKNLQLTGKLTLPAGATLTVEGDSAVNYGTADSGVYSAGSLTIDGTGSLTVTGASSGTPLHTASYAIRAYNSLTIKGGTITAVGGAASNASGSAQSYGLYCSGTGDNPGAVSITGGTVNAAGGKASGSNQDISAGIGCNAESGAAATVTVSDGSVTAVGGESNSGSCGIYVPDTGSADSKLAISGGTVKAESSLYAQGAGLYAEAPAAITGGTVDTVGLYARGLTMENGATVTSSNTVYMLAESDTDTFEVALEGAGTTLRVNCSAYNCVVANSLRVGAGATLALSGAVNTVGVNTHAFTLEPGATFTADMQTGGAALLVYSESADAIVLPSGALGSAYELGSYLMQLSGGSILVYSIVPKGGSFTLNPYTGAFSGAVTTLTLPVPATPTISSGGGNTTQTTTNPDGSTTTVVTKPDGSTVTTDKQPDGVTTVTSADKSGAVTGAEVTVPDSSAEDVPVSIPAQLGEEPGAVTVVVTYPDGTSVTTAGVYSDGKLNIVVTGSATVELGDDFTPLSALPLTDVDSGDYYYDAVIWAALKGITGGKTEATFAPDDACTREQFVTFLWRAAGSPEFDGAMGLAGYEDADEISDYAYDAMHWAVLSGIMDGTSDSTLSPKAIVDRAQAVTFLWRTSGKPVVNFAMSFTDVPSGEYYTEAVRWAVSEGITDGTTTTTFSPTQPCTRGQIVAFLWRQMGK